MILAVLASDAQKKEIAVSPFFSKHEVVYSENYSLWPNHAADVFMDLCFEKNQERITELAKLLPKPVLVNSVIETLDNIHPAFIRINAWPGFLKGKHIEAAAHEDVKEQCSFLFGDDLIFVPDKPGFISARIVAMIINEAYITLGSGTSSMTEIDIAMKLGTGYPFGPFEWATMIGTGQVAGLLNKLEQSDSLYEPAKNLVMQELK